MTTINPFDLLGDDEYNDPSEVLAAAELKKSEKPKKPAASAPSHAQPAKLPSKPLPPAQAVKESRNEGVRTDRGRAVRGASNRGNGRGRNSYIRDTPSYEPPSGGDNGYKPSEEGDGKTSNRRSYSDRPLGSSGGFRGARRGGFSNGESEGERPKRVFERRSGTGRGSEVKRDGAGRGNWGSKTDMNVTETEAITLEPEKDIVIEKTSIEEANKENPPVEKEPEPEDKEMTLEEYERMKEEKRKALVSLKAQERVVDLDKEFKSMLPLSSKKTNDEIFIKLGCDKDKKKEIGEKDEKSKKSLSINEFLKPAEGERYYGGGGRGRGRGRGDRAAFASGFNRDVVAPKIEDPGHFPSLSGK